MGKDGRVDCPECGRQLHTIANEEDLLKCFNGPKYWRETEEGGLVDVTDEVRNDE